MNPPNLSQWLNKFLFIHARTSQPDGRPLYAYKCLPKKYKELKSMFTTWFPEWRKESANIPFNALFCLFAAETWRRCHTGGAWAWETVFREINVDVPGHAWRKDAVRTGLQFWKRPILQTKSGHHQFLVTIACEGGLPLKLLQNDNAALYRYFRKLLKNYHLEKKFGTTDASKLAEELAHLLPASLRRDIVFTLSGNLITQIVELQEKVEDALDPVAALDEQDKKWRNRLPLPLEDDTIERLLKNLVREASRLSITSRQKIKWKRLLIKRNNAWTVEKILELPASISESTLAAWINTENPPQAMRLILRCLDHTRPIGVLTRLNTADNETMYRCELYGQGDIKLTGQNAIAETSLSLTAGQQEFALNVPGSEELGPLPWFFVEKKAAREFTGEGSVKTRQNTLYVLVPENGSFTHMDTTPVSEGDAPNLKRKIFVVSQSGEWKHETLGSCTFHCSSDDEQVQSLSLKGQKMLCAIDDNPPYLGIPELVSMNSIGQIRKISDAKVEWCHASMRGAGWRQDRLGCRGEVWLRYKGRDNQILLLRKAKILPESFKYSISAISNNAEDPGRIQVSGGDGCRILCEDEDNAEFNVISRDNLQEISCTARNELPPASFKCILSWGQYSSLTITLPFPAAGASFMKKARPVPNGRMVAVSRLSSVTAVVQKPTNADFVMLEARITSSNAKWISGYSFTKRVFFDQYGRGTFDLFNIQERISSLLALTGDLDAVAELKLVNQTGERLAFIKTGLFEWKFRPEYQMNLVFPDYETMEQIEEDWQEKISVKIMKLWNPDADPVSLERYGGSVGWEVPIYLEPGPWLVVGEDGDWPRFRPVLWVIPGEPEAVSGSLEKAIREPDRSSREKMMAEAVDQLVNDPDHADWLKFDSFLKLTRRYPPTVFDFFRFFTQNPEAMVMALLRSDDENFNTVWGLSDQLPFLWHLVPVRAWRDSALRYHEALTNAIASLGQETAQKIVWETFKKNREIVKTRQPCFAEVYDWFLDILFPEKTLPECMLNVARANEDIVLNFIQKEEKKFQERHAADARYPESIRIIQAVDQQNIADRFAYRHLASHLRPVRCAPFVAVDIATKGMQYDNFLMMDLKKMRDFDKEWFDCSYAAGLCIELAKINGEGDR